MIPIGEGCHYIAEKQSHALLRGLVPKHHSDFVVLLELSSKDTKILEFNLIKHHLFFMQILNVS